MALPKPTDPAGIPGRFMRLVLTVDIEIEEGAKPRYSELADAVIEDLEDQRIEVYRGLPDNQSVTDLRIQAVYTKHTTLPGRKVEPAILGQIAEER